MTFQEALKVAKPGDYVMIVDSTGKRRKGKVKHTTDSEIILVATGGVYGRPIRCNAENFAELRQEG